MGWGFGEAKRPCASNAHHFMRYVPRRGTGRVAPKPVGLKAPLVSDFCCYCRLTREELGLEVT